MAMKTLDDLFVHFLRDIYYAEKQGVKEMRGMARKASSPELKALIEEHREETEEQVEMLETVFEQMQMRARGVKCEAMEGIASEAHDIMEEAEDPAARDCGIVAAIQAVEHYEITRYGTMIAWARALGKTEAADVFARIRDQEVAADDKLSKLAEETLNAAALGDAAPRRARGKRDADMKGDADMEGDAEMEPEDVDDEALDDDGRTAKAELAEMDDEITDDGGSSAGGQQRKRGVAGRGKKAA